MKKKEKCKLTIIRMIKTQNTEYIKCFKATTLKP